jgi:hypothetical protein
VTEDEIVKDLAIANCGRPPNCAHILPRSRSTIFGAGFTLAGAAHSKLPVLRADDRPAPMSPDCNKDRSQCRSVRDHLAMEHFAPVRIEDGWAEGFETHHEGPHAAGNWLRRRAGLSVRQADVSKENFVLAAAARRVVQQQRAGRCGRPPPPPPPKNGGGPRSLNGFFRRASEQRALGARIPKSGKPGFREKITPRLRAVIPKSGDRVFGKDLAPDKRLIPRRKPALFTTTGPLKKASLIRDLQLGRFTRP